MSYGTQLRILNGRTIGDTMGRVTFYNTQGTAIDDYCVCSVPLLANVYAPSKLATFYPSYPTIVP